MGVAVIGMGRMGRALAGRLQAKGLEVTIWNRTPGRAPDLVAAGVTEAATLAEAAGAADSGVVLLSLSDDAAVRDVVFGAGDAGSSDAGGLVEVLGPNAAGPVLVDTSTVSPVTSRAVAGALAGRMVAAPVFGAPHALAAGTARYVVGGAGEVIGQLGWLFSHLGPHSVVGDDPGLATTVKILGNYLLMAAVATLGEVVALGQASGFDDERLRELLLSLPMVAPAIHNRVDDLLAGDHQGWFSTVLGAKDVGLAERLARDLGLDAALAPAVRARYEAAAAAGWADADIAAVVEVVRGRRGV